MRVRRLKTFGVILRRLDGHLPASFLQSNVTLMISATFFWDCPWHLSNFDMFRSDQGLFLQRRRTMGITERPSIQLCSDVAVGSCSTERRKVQNCWLKIPLFEFSLSTLCLFPQYLPRLPVLTDRATAVCSGPNNYTWCMNINYCMLPDRLLNEGMLIKVEVGEMKILKPSLVSSFIDPRFSI